MHVYINQVPKQFANKSIYGKLAPSNDGKKDTFDITPRLGAFEVSFRGIIMYSKLLS